MDAKNITIEEREKCETRVCKTCGDEKFLGEFYRRGKNVAKWYHQCKNCWNKRTEDWRHNNPEQFEIANERRRADGRRRRYRLTAFLKEKYGLSLEWYDEQMARQKGRCDSCGDKLDEINPSGKPTTQRWPTMPCIHHSHTHGDVINILCSRCNMAEGWIGTPERARKLWKYMERDSLFYASKNGDHATASITTPQELVAA